MLKVIEDVKVDIHFSHHSIERLDRTGLTQCKLQIDDIIPIFYHQTIEGDSLVWAIQDYIKGPKETELIIIDETARISLAIAVFYDYLLQELNIIIKTIWDGTDIRIAFGEPVIYTKSVI